MIRSSSRISLKSRQIKVTVGAIQRVTDRVLLPTQVALRGFRRGFDDRCVVVGGDGHLRWNHLRGRRLVVVRVGAVR